MAYDKEEEHDPYNVDQDTYGSEALTADERDLFAELRQSAVAAPEWQELVRAPGFMRRRVSLALSGVLHDLARRPGPQPFSRQRYDLVSLALAALDAVVSRQGLEDEATTEEIVRFLTGMAERAAPDRPRHALEQVVCVGAHIGAALRVPPGCALEAVNGPLPVPLRHLLNERQRVNGQLRHHLGVPEREEGFGQHAVDGRHSGDLDVRLLRVEVEAPAASGKGSDLPNAPAPFRPVVDDHHGSGVRIAPARRTGAAFRPVSEGTATLERNT